LVYPLAFANAIVFLLVKWRPIRAGQIRRELLSGSKVKRVRIHCRIYGPHLTGGLIVYILLGIKQTK
jgi:hypothetical protein